MEVKSCEAWRPVQTVASSWSAIVELYNTTTNNGESGQHTYLWHKQPHTSVVWLARLSQYVGCGDKEGEGQSSMQSNATALNCDNDNIIPGENDQVTLF